MKQTAVEWLILKIIKQRNYKDLDWDLIFEQAKEMEKQQKGYSEEEVMDMFHNLSMHLPLHYEFLVKEQFKNK
jgi:hypothetical protein